MTGSKIRSMEIVTERLLLREIQESDWWDVLAYQSDPRYLQYRTWRERTPEDVQAFLEKFICQQGEEPRTHFPLAITLKPSPRLIGICGIRKRTPETHQAELGYELSHNYWERGYATEAGQALLEFGFAELQLHRISAWCIADNIASVRVMEKLGMQREGRLREDRYFKGRRWDSLVYGILEHEWQPHKGRRR